MNPAPPSANSPLNVTLYSVARQHQLKLSNHNPIASQTRFWKLDNDRNNVIWVHWKSSAVVTAGTPKKIQFQLIYLISLTLPAVMAPSAAKLKEALIDGTCEIYKAEPDGTSVNKVRRHVEEKLGLEDGFFTSDTWKHKSKTIIKEQVVSIPSKAVLPIVLYLQLTPLNLCHQDKLLDADGSEPENEPDTKAGIKRQSSEIESPQPKRRKKASGPVKKKEDSDVDKAPKKESKTKVKKLVSRGKAKPDDSDEEETKMEEIPSPAKNRKRDVKDESEDEPKHSTPKKAIRLLLRNKKHRAMGKTRH